MSTYLALQSSDETNFILSIKKAYRQFVFLFAALSAIDTLSASGTLSLVKITDGIYVHYGIHQDLDEGYQGDIANISVIIGSTGIAVIDSGGSREIGKRFLAKIRQLSSLPILYVINTHVHPDHIMGNRIFLDENPQFVGHIKSPVLLKNREAIYRQNNQKWLGESEKNNNVVYPSLLVNDTLTLPLGDRSLTLNAYPTAHSEADLTVFDDKTKTLWTGDLLFVERTPSIDGDVYAWLKAIDKLERLSINYVIPGHGSFNISAWQNQRRYLIVLLQDIRQGIQRKEHLSSIVKTAAETERNNWQLFDPVTKRNVHLLHQILFWE